MKIAICDDDRLTISTVQALLITYQKEQHKDISYHSFNNAIDLIHSMEKENYDILFLDILMPGFNGMQAAKEIRQKNNDIKIIFLTSSTEYAVESYNVQATHYLIKPATKQKLFPILDNLYELLKKPEETLLIRTKSSVFRLPYKQIECIEVMSKTIYFYLTDGSTKTVPGHLAEYEMNLINRREFCKVHRSYIVNLSHVVEISQGQLTTVSGRCIHIARSFYQQVKTAYVEVLFEDANLTNHNNGG